MINTRFIGGGYSLPYHSEKGGQGSVTCSPKRLPKGGQRWDNTSEIGGVING
jgi:hypothetical protein